MAVHVFWYGNVVLSQDLIIAHVWRVLSQTYRGYQCSILSGMLYAVRSWNILLGRKIVPYRGYQKQDYLCVCK